jgi:hypothetical protein
MREFFRSKIWRRFLFCMIAVLCMRNGNSRLWAWGRLGHRVISRLAEQHLSDNAKAGIKALLGEVDSIASSSADRGNVSSWERMLRAC